MKTQYQTPIGAVTLACNDGKLIGLWNDGQKYHGNDIFKGMTEKNDVPVFDATKKWLDGYFAGKKPSISELPLAPVGTDFRQSVWKILCEIPYGKVVSYGDIAKKMAAKMGRKSMASRAIGGAVGHNPISIIIPCHRVIGANGTLTGYAGGVDIKIKLLELEGVGW
ncbi:MAG: methylated-DNA--[protein]-cysteine S-methyltransferase [Chitinispirillales bacterium]|nr:methylated-DNA--[protein]-cysteine S-methyltransferase [Chitinispirillales bacterium]